MIMENENPLVKPCQYPKCKNTVLAESEFTYCEVCRILALRNQVTILMDPSAPITDRREMIFHTMVHNMRPDEIINAVQKIEWIYLELQKQLSTKKLEEHRRSKFAESIADMNEKRAANSTRAPKVKAKKESKQKSVADKLRLQFGNAAAEIYGKIDENEDFGF